MGSSEKAAEGSSDEDEGALVIDEKNERGGNKRKAEESVEVSCSLNAAGPQQTRDSLPGQASFDVSQHISAGVIQAAEGSRGKG